MGVSTPPYLDDGESKIFEIMIQKDKRDHPPSKLAEIIREQINERLSAYAEPKSIEECVGIIKRFNQIDNKDRIKINNREAQEIKHLVRAIQEILEESDNFTELQTEFPEIAIKNSRMLSIFLGGLGIIKVNSNTGHCMMRGRSGLSYVESPYESLKYLLEYCLDKLSS